MTMRKLLVYFAFSALIVWLGRAIVTEAQNQASERKTIVLQKPPARFIKDPNPSFAAVAVNSEHDMLVVADDNMLQIMEYRTKENTPATARFSEAQNQASERKTIVLQKPPARFIK